MTSASSSTSAAKPVHRQVADPTPAAWLTPVRVMLFVLPLLCALQLYYRVDDAISLAEQEARTALNLYESQSPAALTVGVVTRPAVLSLSHCMGGQCGVVYVRPGAAPCNNGLSWEALCVTVHSVGGSDKSESMRITYDLQPSLQQAGRDALIIMGLGLGVLMMWRRGTQGLRDDRAAHQQQAQKVADLDPLTGLLNRVAFESALKRHNEAKNPSALHAGGCLMYFDLDRFKIINDTHGHGVGDVVLKTVAQRLRYALGDKALIGRLGGDEFAVLLDDVSSSATIEQIGHLVIEQVSTPIQMDSVKDSVGLSIGAFLVKTGVLSVGEMLHRADLAMYEAKRAGRGRLVFFEDAMEEASRTRAQLQIDLKRAMRDRQFFMVYQPQIDSHDRIRGVEALVRWQHPQRGIVPPDEFIPIAEQTGMIVPLGKLIIDLVCEDLVALRGQRVALPYVSVNLSVRQLGDRAFVADVMDALQKHRLRPADIEFEITESTAMAGRSDKEHSASLRKLADLGFRLAVDDFGTGYSSIARLLDLKVDKLKIDRAFVSTIGKPNFDPALLELMISLAKRLGVKSVAEGVETASQVVWLRQAGCQMLQGDFIAKPMGQTQLSNWLRLQLGDNGFEERIWAKTSTFATLDEAGP